MSGRRKKWPKTTTQENNGIKRLSGRFFHTIAYVQQKQYTATLAIDAIMTPGSQSYENVRDFVDEFYSGSQKKMQDLGEAMAAEVDKALADGVITQDEYLNIQNIQAKLQELINQTENAQYKAKIKSMQMQVDGGKLSAESFQNIMSTAGEQLQTQLDAADQAFLELVTPIQIQLENGEITEAEADAFMRDAQEDLNRKKGELILENVTVGIDTLQANYANELDSFTKYFEKDLNTSLSGAKIDPSGAIHWGDVLDGLKSGYESIAPEVRGSAAKMLESMQPNIQQLEEVAQSYLEVGKTPPENIVQGLQDAYQLDAMTGSTEHIYDLLAAEIAGSEEYQNALLTARKNGQEIPEELAKGLKDLYGLELVEEGGKIMWQVVDEQAQTSAQVMQETFRQYGIELPDALAAGLDSKSASLVEATLQLLRNLEDGKKLKEEELTSVFSTLGVELPESLITSLSNQNPGVQQQAIELFSQIQYADNEKRPELLTQMLELGQNVDASLCSGIANNLVLVKDEAAGMISVLDSTTGTEITRITPGFAKKLKKMGSTGFDSMDEAMKSGKLTAPKVNDISTQPVKDWQSNSQYYLNRHPLTAKIQAGAVAGADFFSSIAKNADGGIIEKQTLSWLAEGDQPEAVIPLSTSKRSRGIELWQQAGEELGVMDGARNTMATRIQNTGGSDTRRLAAALAAELRKAPIEVNPQFHVSAGDVYLDKEQVGRSLSPVIDTELSQIQGIRRRGG